MNTRVRVGLASLLLFFAFGLGNSTPSVFVPESGRTAHKAAVEHAHAVACVFEEAADVAVADGPGALDDWLTQRVQDATADELAPLLEELHAGAYPDGETYDPDAVAKRLRELATGLRRVK